MKECLNVLLNKVFIRDLELLYGKDSKIILNSVKYCTNNHNFIIDCKLILSDISLFEELQYDGLEVLVSDSWKFTGFDSHKFVLISTCDITT